MEKICVKTLNGYVVDWLEIEFNGYEEVEHEGNVHLLTKGWYKVVNGKTVIDKEVKESIIATTILPEEYNRKTSEIYSELVALKEQNELLTRNNEMLLEAVALQQLENLSLEEKITLMGGDSYEV